MHEKKWMWVVLVLAGCGGGSNGQSHVGPDAALHDDLSLDGAMAGDLGMCTGGGDSCTPSNPCHVGTTSCASGSVTCVDTGGLVAVGTSCGNGLVCNGGGACTTCASGASCTPAASPCHTGTVSCASGQPACVDSGSSVVDGTSCGTNLVCASGACGPCTEGAACAPGGTCHRGVTSCSSGTPMCTDAGNEPDGTVCGSGEGCLSGACVACVEGASCTISGCQAGTWSCSGGTSTCVATGAIVTPGTSCGTGQVCSTNGNCVTCVDGASCTLATAICDQATIVCASGAPVCTDTGTPADDGTSCGTNQVCGNGACASCTAGLACTPTNPCDVGATSCALGSSVCSDTSVKQPDGTACGSGKVCAKGSCVACVDGAACTPANACHVGSTSCANGSSACVDTDVNAKAGASCGSGKVCDGTGACNACAAGTTCTPASNPCLKGAIDCSTGVAVCQSTGIAVANDTSCGTNAMCESGTCESCTTSGSCTPPDPCQLGTTLTCPDTHGGYHACIDAGPDSSQDGKACPGSGTCASGTCACPPHSQYSGGGCNSCTYSSGNTYGVVGADPATVDGPCCGVPGFGACKTVKQLMTNLINNGVSGAKINVGTFAPEEPYPIHLGMGVTLQLPRDYDSEQANDVTIAGSNASTDIFAIDLDASTVTIVGDGNGSSIGAPNNPSKGPTARDGIVVRAPNATTQPTLVLSGDVGIRVLRDAIHVDGGKFVAPSNTYSTYSVSSAWADTRYNTARSAVRCASETYPSTASVVDATNILNFRVNDVSTHGIPYGIFASHGCSLTGAVNLSGGMNYGLWVEGNAGVNLTGTISSMNLDSVAVMPGAYPSESPTVNLTGMKLQSSHCAGVHAERGNVTVGTSNISGNRWGILQRSSSTASGTVQVVADGPASCGSSGSPCGNVITGYYSNFGAPNQTVDVCCPSSASCGQGANIYNNSAFPLSARYDTIGSCPNDVCTCTDAALQTCTCTNDQPNAKPHPVDSFVSVILAPYTTGTPTVDLTGNTCH